MKSAGVNMVSATIDLMAGDERSILFLLCKIMVIYLSVITATNTCNQ